MLEGEANSQKSDIEPNKEPSKPSEEEEENSLLVESICTDESKAKRRLMLALEVSNDLKAQNFRR